MAYDNAYRLTTETVTTGTDIVVTSYTYDDAHNRTSKVVEKNSVVEENNLYTFNNNLNQIDSFTDGNRTVSFGYDANGNRILRVEEDNQQTVTGYSQYVYDQENRLISLAIWNSEPALDSNGLPEMVNGEYVTAPDDLYRYGYDYRTRRVERTENGETTLLTFSAGLSVREYLVNGQGTPELQVEFIRGSDYGGGIGGILYSLRGGIPSYAHYNRRGDVVARTDESGSLTYQASYEAFGRHGDTPGTEEWGDSPDRQRANTKEEDPTGLLNEGFRYRCLETGVFLTRDPLGFVDGPNVYTYVVQNPWTYFDPLGLRFDSSTFNSDEDRMKRWDELDSNVQRQWRRYGANDGAEWNSRVNHFNDELNKMRETPFGSALYDFLKTSENIVDFGFTANERSFARKNPFASRRDGSSLRFSEGAEYDVIAHEMIHSLQHGGFLTRTEWKGPSNLVNSLGAVVDANDTNKTYPEGANNAPVQQWIEAQAVRGQNITENEYKFISAPRHEIAATGRRVPHLLWNMDVVNNEFFHTQGRNRYGRTLPVDSRSGSYFYDVDRLVKMRSKRN